MVGAVVVTHGKLAMELVSAAKKIVGDNPRLKAICIDWDDDVAAARSVIEAGLKEVDAGQGVLILTDMFGGTPTNISLTFLEPAKVEILTGVNLPMLIKFLNVPDDADMATIVEQLKDKGRRSIQAASSLLSERVARKAKDG